MNYTKNGQACKSGVLRKLGIYGMDPIEDGFIAGLAIGDPVLLVGGVGQAKTLLVEETARALNMKFCAYSAEKALFEDILGPFDPRALMDGRVGYLDTEVTIWDKEIVLIDELSRANPAMQNKWLEVIRSRRVMGKGLSRLRYVLAAMNPPGLLGTNPLDEALAGRFTFVLSVPDVADMSEADRIAVVETVSAVDAPELHTEKARALPDLKGLLRAVVREYRAVERMLGPKTTAYVLNVADYLAAKDVRLDGRRLAMMRRGLLGLTAVGRIMGRLPSDGGLLPLDLFRRGLDMTLPFIAMGRALPAARIDGAHKHAASALAGRRRRLMTVTNLFEAARRLIKGNGPWDDSDAASLLVSRICAAVERPKKSEVSVQAGAALMTLAARPEALSRLRPEARHRILVCWRGLCSIPPGSQGDFMDRVNSLDLDTVLNDTAFTTALRCAFTISQRIEQAVSVTGDFDRLASKLVKTLEQGGVS